MTLLIKILFFFSALYVGSLNASATDEISEAIRLSASLKPGSDPVRIERMLSLTKESGELEELAFNDSKRSLIHYVEEHQKFQSERIVALDLSEAAYGIQISAPLRAITVQGVDQVEQSIVTLERIIRLQKQVILWFYDQLQQASIRFYQGARGPCVEFAPSKIFLRLIQDERAGTTKGKEIFVARLMLAELNQVAIKEAQLKPAKKRGRASQPNENGFSLDKATELKQSLWDFAERIAGMENGLGAHMAQTMKEFTVDVACLRAGVEFFNDSSAIKGKQIRTGVIRELNRLSPEEVDGRIRLVNESLELAQQMRDTSRIKKAVTVLSSLINVKVLKSTDRTAQANLFLKIAKLSEQYSTEEPFDIVVNYCNAFMLYPDATVRRAVSGDLQRLLPPSYDAYESWKGRLAPQSTRAVLESLEKLRWFHIKLLLLEGNSADSLKLLKPRKPKPMRVEAKPVSSLEIPPVVEQASYSPPPRREPETSDDEREWNRYEAISSSQEESRKMKQEMLEKAKALDEKEARKKALKEAKERRLADGVTEESELSDDDVAVPHQVLSLATNAYSIFEKFFLLKGAGGARALEMDVPLSEYDRLTFEDKVDITPDDFKILVDALNGTAQRGKGSHRKAKISPLSFVLNGKQIELVDLEEEFSAVASQTVTYTQTPYLPFYQIEQIREKLLALGYSPRTVSAVKGKV